MSQSVPLVLINDIAPKVAVDLKYASTNNFTGKTLYPNDFTARVQPKVAEALFLAQNELEKVGLTLVIWDACRPLKVQEHFLKLIKDERYVKRQSHHITGLAVDVSLRNDDGYLDMGTDFDDFTEKAHTDSKQITAEQRANRELLAGVMAAHYFKQWPYEWWHFDYSPNS